MSFPVPHKTVETLKNFGMLSDPAIVPNPSQIRELQSALQEDAEAYLYNGIISFGAAIHSINAKNYGWAIVKFYYSVFYLARSKLGLNQFAIVYNNKTPYLLSLFLSPPLNKQTGKDAGSTHKLVLKLLGANFPNSSLSNQRISADDIPILEWLMRQREIVNYTSAMMPDPEPPKILKKVVKNPTINKWLESYKQDKLLYVIDEEHACLAYPFLFLLEVLEEFKAKGYLLNSLKTNLNFIKNLFTEKGNKNVDSVLSTIRNLA